MMMAQFIPEIGMDSFTIRDLRERTGDLVRNAEAGQLSVVAKHGHPLFVAVPLDETVLGRGVNVALACRLFQDKTLSLAKAARLAGLSAEAFIEQLGVLGIPAADYPPAELDEEMAALDA
jgi:prevent-host-death family protein